MNERSPPETFQQHEHHPILIVGAGPIGLTIANLLGVYNVEALIVERNATTVQEARAVSIDDEALRTMEAIGLSDTVMTGVVAGYGSRYLTPGGRCFLTVRPTGQPYGYPRRNAFRQPLLEAQLREGLTRFSHVNTAFGWSLTAFEQDADLVHATLTGPDGITKTVTCEYLVGSDGGRSFVRKRLGVSMRGTSLPERWLIVDLENSPVDDANTLVFCDSRRAAIALPGPNNTRRFEFKLRRGEADEDVLDDDVVQRLLNIHGAHPDSQIKRKIVYTFHALNARPWRVGRVFLAGDAAHLTPPFAGQGMNSGLRDAHNLAWKLAEVVEKRLPCALLNTYEEERSGHVAQMIDLALRLGRVMGPSSALSGWLMQTGFSLASACPPLKSYFGEMKFRPSPHIESGFLIPGKHPLIGRLLPLPEGTEPDGVRFDSKLGDHFAIVGTGVDQNVLEDLVSRGPWPNVRTRAVSVTPDRAGPWDLNEDKLCLLVRPDRYVMAVAPLGEMTRLERDFAALIAFSHPPARQQTGFVAS